MNSKITTEELLSELNSLKEPHELDNYLKKHEKELKLSSLSDYLNTVLEIKGIDLHKYVKNCGIPSSYAYNIFSGKRKHPDKYKLLPICITLGLDYQETSKALLLAGQPQLSPRITKDAVIILCMNQHITDIDEINQLLYAQGEEPF